MAGPSRPIDAPAPRKRGWVEIEARMIAPVFRLRKHADYQRVYAASRKQFSRQMSYFFAVRSAGAENSSGGFALSAVPRVGLTVGKAMGKAVERNRIKRRMREAVRRNLPLLTGPVDVILHPRRSVLALDFADLDREVAQVFRAIERWEQSGGPATSARARPASSKPSAEAVP